jgi:hypothetical protein
MKNLFSINRGSFENQNGTTFSLDEVVDYIMADAQADTVAGKNLALVISAVYCMDGAWRCTNRLGNRGVLSPSEVRLLVRGTLGLAEYLIRRVRDIDGRQLATAEALAMALERLADQDQHLRGLLARFTPENSLRVWLVCVEVLLARPLHWPVHLVCRNTGVHRIPPVRVEGEPWHGLKAPWDQEHGGTWEESFPEDCP